MIRSHSFYAALSNRECLLRKFKSSTYQNIALTWLFRLSAFLIRSQNKTKIPLILARRWSQCDHSANKCFISSDLFGCYRYYLSREWITRMRHFALKPSNWHFCWPNGNWRNEEKTKNKPFSGTKMFYAFGWLPCQVSFCCYC